MRRRLAALLLFCAWAPPASAARPARKAGAAGATMTVESRAARFRCAAPRWEKVEDVAGDAREKVYGVTLREPVAAPRQPTLITIEWYAPENALFSSADAYVAVNAATGPVAGASVGPVERAQVAGRPARRWTARTFTVSAPNSVRAERVEVRSEHVVVEAPGGFYALSFSAPADVFDAKKAAFRRVLDTFAPRP